MFLLAAFSNCLNKVSCFKSKMCAHAFNTRCGRELMLDLLARWMNPPCARICPTFIKCRDAGSIGDDEHAKRRSSFVPATGSKMVEAEVRLTRENRVSTDVFMTALVLTSLRLSHRFYTTVSDIIFQTFFVLVIRRSLVVRCRLYLAV